MNEITKTVLKALALNTLEDITDNLERPSDEYPRSSIKADVLAAAECLLAIQDGGLETLPGVVDELVAYLSGRPSTEERQAILEDLARAGYRYSIPQ